MTTDVTTTGVGTIRSGFLGGGFMAHVHSRAARAAGATTALLASSSAARAQAAAQDLGIERAAADIDELLAGDIDIVHVCTPNATHAALAMAVIDAGIHVICEKPLATTAADARALAHAADQRGVVAAVPFVYR